jgi:hypothetical protein
VPIKPSPAPSPYKNRSPGKLGKPPKKPETVDALDNFMYE